MHTHTKAKIRRFFRAFSLSRFLWALRSARRSFSVR